ncbi:MAG: GPW/gp25 family protein [Candidatus Nitrosocosmicus sp.]|nr:GPW/gp25 family protein [Candidatus Nitrosocosmicus sp.]
MNNYYNFPFIIDNNGLTKKVDSYDEYIRQLIQQVLFTSQGERVNRPTFGSGLNLLLFEPNSQELSSTTQMLVQSSLQLWLGDLITVQSVSVKNIDSSLHITVRYIVNLTQEAKETELKRDL